MPDGSLGTIEKRSDKTRPQGMEWAFKKGHALWNEPYLSCR